MKVLEILLFHRVFTPLYKMAFITRQHVAKSRIMFFELFSNKNFSKSNPKKSHIDLTKRYILLEYLKFSIKNIKSTNKQICGVSKKDFIFKKKD